MWITGGGFQLHNKFGLCTEQVEKQNLFCASSEHPIKEIKARWLWKHQCQSYACLHFHFFEITVAIKMKMFTLENISVQPGWLGSSPPGRRTRKLRISDSEITPVTWVACLSFWKKTNDAKMQDIWCHNEWNGGSKIAMCYRNST